MTAVHFSPNESSKAAIEEREQIEQDWLDKITALDIIDALHDEVTMAALDLALEQGSVEMAGLLVINLHRAKAMRMAAQETGADAPSDVVAVVKALRGVRVQ